ncbi:channel protein TolC, partial [Pseudomonas aeruginosa]
DKTDVLEAQPSIDTARANRLLSEQRVDDAVQALETLTNRDYSAIVGMRHTMPLVPPATNDAHAWVYTEVPQNLRLLAS